MLNDKQKLETYFKEEIKRVSDIEIEQIEKEISSIRKKSIQGFEAEAQREAETAREQALKELYNEHTIRLSKLRENSNHKRMAKRTELCDKVFYEVIQEMKEFTLSKEYKEYLYKKVAALAEKSSDFMILYVAKKDEKLLPELCHAYGPNCQGEVDPSIKIGGFRGLCEAKGMVIDETFDSSIDEQRSWFYTNSGLFIK